jgi:hypothetical protein
MRRIGLLVASLVMFTAFSVVAQPMSTPVVVFVHGRGQIDVDPVALRTEWWNSLQAGIAAITTKPLLNPSNVELVWYANQLGPMATNLCSHHETNQRSQRMWFNRQSFQSFWTTARTWTVAAVGVVPIADRLITQRLMDDVYVYLSDLQRRCAADEEFRRVITPLANQGRPVIIVAHSLG